MEQLIKEMVLSFPLLPLWLQNRVERTPASIVAETYTTGRYCEYCPAFHRCNNGPALIARNGRRVVVPEMTEDEKVAAVLALILLLALS